jgi:hypothetical protein
MSRALGTTLPRRLARGLALLALLGGLTLVLGGPASAYASVPPPSMICLHCIVGPTISVTTDGYGHISVSGQGFTPGGSVQVVATMPPDGAGGGGTTTNNTYASLPWGFCGPYGCYFFPGGTIATTFPITFSCGGGLTKVTVSAQDINTGLWSNAVSIYPWGKLPC